MLNKKIVVIREWDDEEQCFYEYDSVPAVVDDNDFADAIAHPWKYLFGSIRKSMKDMAEAVAQKFVNLYRFSLVETFSNITPDDFNTLLDWYDPGEYEVRMIGNDANIYRISIIDRFADTISKFNLHKRLNWLVPYVLQWTLDEENDELTSDDGKFILKAVVA